MSSPLVRIAGWLEYLWYTYIRTYEGRFCLVVPGICTKATFYNWVRWDESIHSYVLLAGVEGLSVEEIWSLDEESLESLKYVCIYVYT